MDEATESRIRVIEARGKRRDPVTENPCDEWWLCGVIRDLQAELGSAYTVRDHAIIWKGLGVTDGPWTVRYLDGPLRGRIEAWPDYPPPVIHLPRASSRRMLEQGRSHPDTYVTIRQVDYERVGIGEISRSALYQVNPLTWGTDD